MKPILFNTEMVRAILEGRKTVTRRIANINTEITCNDGTTNHEFVMDNFSGEPTPSGFVCRKCGFGVAHPHNRVPCGTSLFRPRYWPGDILYVRETFTKEGDRYYYRADFESDWLDRCETLSGGYPAACRHRNCDTCCAEGVRIRWKPSIHMPKEAARIFLRVKSVRIERLQNITEGDAIKEGVPDEWPMEPVYCPECKGEGLVGALHPGTLGYMEVDCPCCEKAVKRFENLWNSTIKPDYLSTCGWNANPWVWAIEFEKCKRPEEVSLMAEKQRLIDANDLVRCCEFAKSKLADNDSLTALDLLIKALKQAPTVDAVAVVRCKDCKFSYINSLSAAQEKALCNRWLNNDALSPLMNADDFCSYGERRDDGSES